jgi:glutamyl-tRNA synthetase
VIGRFAPSPTGTLHLGNLRTALVAWLAARSAGSSFLVRMEDLDRITASRQHEIAQLDDLGLLGLDWDGDVVRQSDRFELHREALNRLAHAGLTYECFCTRREIREAASAPNGPLLEGGYPGTCRSLTAAQRSVLLHDGRRPAIRLRAGAAVRSFDDAVCGTVRGVVDDVVLQRSDGVPAYNLAVVVDDDEQGVEQVVRADDLLSVTPSQILIGELIGARPMSYAHLPLVVNDEGQRLAKRDRGSTLEDQASLGRDAVTVRSMLAASLGLCPPGTRATMAELIDVVRCSRSISEIDRRQWTAPSEPADS